MAGQSATAEWDAVSFSIRSKYRVAVLDQLEAGPRTPAQIATAADLALAHISRAIGELRERGLVELLVSEGVSKGRLYALTETGDDVWTLIEDGNLHTE